MGYAKYDLFSFIKIFKLTKEQRKCVAYIAMSTRRLR
jgi:hypothetical protein